MSGAPHLLLICPRSDILGKLLGLPIAATIVHRPGGDRKLEESVALRVVDADFTDTAQLLEVAREVHRHRPVDGVLGLTELSLAPVSTVVADLGVRGNSPETLGTAQNKAAMRRRLAECGLPSAGHRLCESIEHAAEFLRECPHGIVLKPVDGNGGSGVHLVRDESDLDTAWAWSATSKSGFTWRGDAVRQQQVLAEEYLTGTEFSVESISAEGKHAVLAVTGKHTSGPPHFVELGHDLPADLPAAQYDLVAAAALDALTGIGYAWGAAHTEVMLAPDGNRATVVEINARQGGDQIWELVQLATGYDLLAAAMLALGTGAVPAPPGPAAAAAIRYVSAAPGTIERIDGVADALAVPGVLRVGELPGPGDEIAPLRDSWNRAGYVIATAGDLPTAVAAAETAVSRITVHTGPGKE